MHNVHKWCKKSQKWGFRPFSLLNWLGSGVFLILCWFDWTEIAYWCSTNCYSPWLHIDVVLIVTHHLPSLIIQMNWLCMISIIPTRRAKNEILFLSALTTFKLFCTRAQHNNGTKHTAVNEKKLGSFKNDKKYQKSRFFDLLKNGRKGFNDILSRSSA